MSPSAAPSILASRALDGFLLDFLGLSSLTAPSVSVASTAVVSPSSPSSPGTRRREVLCHAISTCIKGDDSATHLGRLLLLWLSLGITVLDSGTIGSGLVGLLLLQSLSGLFGSLSLGDDGLSSSSLLLPRSGDGEGDLSAVELCACFSFDNDYGNGDPVSYSPPSLSFSTASLAWASVL